MRLLNRTATAYIITSILVLLVSIPIFYFVLHHLFAKQADSTLKSRKEFVVSKLGKIKNDQEIQNWTRFEDDIDVSRLPLDTQPLPDSIYDRIQGKDDYFRELVTQVTIYGKPHRLVIRSSMLENHELIQTIVTSQALLLAVLLICLLLINRQISRQVWQPFYDTLAKLKNYSINQHIHLQLSRTPILEFSELNEAVGKMTRKIQADFISLKQFTENASHEIQTPLAIIQSKLEVMIQDEALSREQMQNLQTIYEATGRLSKLNQALFLLTKIENNQFSGTERLNLKELIEVKLLLFEDFIKAKNLTVETVLVDHFVEMNAPLARVMLTNLIGNAIKHNTHGGTLGIILTDTYLAVSNSGTAPTQATETFFDRFNKANPNSDSLGLGLAIVKEICEYSQFKIHYEYQDGIHTLRIQF
ncbi:HAMP domain-containing sensor histidine kinase [Runella sp.]|uniref:sensor histidine kinase n=1 Tax=Runella sp. TaxID=1960881 RepID=UPI00301931F6